MRIMVWLPFVVLLFAGTVQGSTDVRDMTLGARTCSEGVQQIECFDEYTFPDNLPFDEAPLNGSAFTLHYGCQAMLAATGLQSAQVACDAFGLNLTSSCSSITANKPAGAQREMVTISGVCTVPYSNGTTDWGTMVTADNSEIINVFYRLQITPVREVDFMATEIAITSLLDDWIPFLVFAAAAIWGWQGRNLMLAVIGSVGMLGVFVLPLWTTEVLVLFGVLAIWADYFAHYGRRKDQAVEPGAPGVGGGRE